MIVYHGSNSRFRTLKISKSLVKYESTKSNEGIGIYFSTDKNIADSYGKYVYTLEINDNYFVDYRNKSNCIKYVKSICSYIKSKEKVDINNYIDTNKLADYLYFGGIAFIGACKEVYLLLDSNEQWYNDIDEKKQQRIYKLLSTYDKNHLVSYMFNYNIKNIGVIKKLQVNGEDVVRILDIEKR